MILLDLLDRLFPKGSNRTLRIACILIGAAMSALGVFAAVAHFAGHAPTSSFQSLPVLLAPAGSGLLILSAILRWSDTAVRRMMAAIGGLVCLVGLWGAVLHHAGVPRGVLEASTPPMLPVLAYAGLGVIAIVLSRAIRFDLIPTAASLRAPTHTPSEGAGPTTAAQA